MIILTNIQFGMKDQTIFVVNDQTDQIKTIARVEIETLPEALCGFYYNNDGHIMQIKGPKDYCNRIVEKTKEKALELYGDRTPINFVIVTGE